MKIGWFSRRTIGLAEAAKTSSREDRRKRNVVRQAGTKKPQRNLLERFFCFFVQLAFSEKKADEIIGSFGLWP